MGFSDDILGKIFMRDEMARLPLETQSEIIHAIEEVLDEQEAEDDE